MKLEPVITEKSLTDAKNGKYTFRVPRSLNKHQIKNLVNKVFGVDVKKAWTIKESGEKKRTLMGRKRVIKPRKKTIVELKGKDKIDLFDTKE